MSLFNQAYYCTNYCVFSVWKYYCKGCCILFSQILWLWLNRNKFSDYLTKPIVTRIIVSLLLENVIIRAAVLFSEILWVWLNMIKFCHSLIKPIIARIIVFLVLENVIIRTAYIVFRDFTSLVKHDQILSLFNQA